MIARLAVPLAVVLLLGGACSRRGAPAQAPKAAATPTGNCNDTSKSVACPADTSDPSGKGLPKPGGLCTVPACKPCGSATVPAFRDDTGAPRRGWCLCVPRSDDSPTATYSCFTLDDWAQRG